MRQLAKRTNAPNLEIPLRRMSGQNRHWANPQGQGGRVLIGQCLTPCILPIGPVATNPPSASRIGWRRFARNPRRYLTHFRPTGLDVRDSYRVTTKPIERQSQETDLIVL